MTIYERIRELCNERKMSVAQLERDLDITKGSICKWKKSTPNASTLDKIVNYFGVPADYILNGWEETPGKIEADAEVLSRAMKDKDALKLLAFYYTLNATERRVVLDYLEFMTNKKDR